MFDYFLNYKSQVATSYYGHVGIKITQFQAHNGSMKIDRIHDVYSTPAIVGKYRMESPSAQRRRNAATAYSVLVDSESARRMLFGAEAPHPADQLSIMESA